MSPREGLVRSRRGRIAAALLISRLPGNGLRKALYSLLLGYRFGRRNKIGYGSFVAVDEFECGDDVIIWNWNNFHGPIKIRIGKGSYIGKHNQICCGHAVEGEWANQRNYGRSVTLGERCLINESHIIDVVGSIEIGDGTWVAGFRSQLMTHGAGVVDRDIRLGRNCFIGSSVMFAPGSSIGDDTMVAMGSVVARKFDESNVVVGGIPAKVIRARDAEDSYNFERTW